MVTTAALNNAIVLNHYVTSKISYLHYTGHYSGVALAYCGQAKGLLPVAGQAIPSSIMCSIPDEQFVVIQELVDEDRQS